MKEDRKLRGECLIHILDIVRRFEDNMRTCPKGRKMAYPRSSIAMRIWSSVHLVLRWHRSERARENVRTLVAHRKSMCRFSAKVPSSLCPANADDCLACPLMGIIELSADGDSLHRSTQHSSLLRADSIPSLLGDESQPRNTSV